MVKKSISWQSFFSKNITRPFIQSYGNFLQYSSKNNIILNRRSRQIALYLYLNKI